jgi:AcrR family transcriptional regulator
MDTDPTPRIHGKTGLTQAQRTARTRSRLLRAALDLIAEGGFQNAILANIGERAGYSRGVVTHTFGSKARLLAQLVERMGERFNHKNLIPAIGDKTGTEALCTTIDETIKAAYDYPVDTRAFYSLLFEALGPLPELREPFAGLHRDSRNNIAALIQKGIDEGSINPSLNATAQAGLIIGALRGTLYQWLLDESFDLHLAGEEHKKSIRIIFSTNRTTI